jgi:hypothetical protein
LVLIDVARCPLAPPSIQGVARVTGTIMVCCARSHFLLKRASADRFLHSSVSPVSLYSSGSAPPTSFNSPVSQNYPLNRDSHSPPQDGGIRLPNNPLSDVASMRHASTTACNPPRPIPRKSHSSSVSYYPPPSLSLIPQDCFSHSQNDASPDGALWAERTETGIVASPTGSL